VGLLARKSGTTDRRLETTERNRGRGIPAYAIRGTPAGSSDIAHTMQGWTP